MQIIRYFTRSKGSLGKIAQQRMRKASPERILASGGGEQEVLVDVSIDALTYGTAGVGRTPDGKAVFVDNTVPGDVVRAEIVQEKKAYATARLIEVLEPSGQRITPVCPHALTCGGCPWQAISYETQLAAKRANIISALIRIGHFEPEFAERVVADCVGSKRQMGYRNKLELATGRDAAGKLIVGMMQARSHDLLPVDACPLVHKTMQKAPKALRGALRFVEGSSDLGIYRVGVRSSVRTHATEVALWTRPGSFPRAAAAKTLASAVKATSIVRVMADPGKQRKVKGVEVLAGTGFWCEELGGYSYKVSAPSFFQVNTAQAEKLVELALAGLEIDEEDRVADLYCGVGTFTLPLAERAGDVIAVESAASSVRDLRRNADEAGVWVDILGGDSARELADIDELDALVVDPPRAGLADSVPQDIAKARPRRIAYISCDPATWARDIARLDSCGYSLVAATPVDLFPQTYHCEVVSILQRK